MNVLLVSTYELGRQPFGLASPAAWLARVGARVDCLDLSRERLDEAKVRAADCIAFYLPMHTATRLAVEAFPKIQALNGDAPRCFYGLYAPVNEDFLRKLGAEAILGGEFEADLVAWVERVRERQDQRAGEQEVNVAAAREPLPPAHSPAEPTISLERLNFLVPDRHGLPKLSRYAHLMLPSGDQRVVGATEASRGCKHFCRHCPVVPVYQGRFRIVQPEIVLEDIRRQVAAGAEHITFGDPDFFNGIGHAIRIVTALHREFPDLSYDATIKVEHLLKHSEHLRTLRETGCLFVTSAVESVDDDALKKLDKGHTRADFMAVVELFRETGLALSPTFVAFTPWTTLAAYIELLAAVAELGLIENVAPIQLAIRLLIPAGSRLLELPEVRELIEPFDEAALVYSWANPDLRVDELASEIQQMVQRGEKKHAGRQAIFSGVWEAVHRKALIEPPPIPEPKDRISRAAIPYLTEPWYC